MSRLLAMVVLVSTFIVALVFALRDGPIVPDPEGAARSDAGSAVPVARTSGGAPGMSPPGERANAPIESAVAAGIELGSEGPAATGSGSPLPIPPDLAQVFEFDEELAAFHRRLGAEERDANWAGRLEQYFEDHFVTELDLNRYRIATLECRATACEILAVGYGDDALRDWMRGASNMIEAGEDELESLMGGSGEMSCGGGEFEPGVYSVHCFFERRIAEAEPAPGPRLPLDAPYPDNVYVEPVEVAEDAARVLESDQQLYELHRRLEQEGTDFAWAEYMEPLIADYLGGAAATAGISVTGIVCRTTLCEVQMVAESEYELIDWVATLYEFQRAGWHDLRTAGFGDTGTTEGEPTGMVWLLERGTAGD